VDAGCSARSQSVWSVAVRCACLEEPQTKPLPHARLRTVVHRTTTRRRPCISSLYTGCVASGHGQRVRTELKHRPVQSTHLATHRQACVWADVALLHGWNARSTHAPHCSDALRTSENSLFVHVHDAFASGRACLMRRGAALSPHRPSQWRVRASFQPNRALWLPQTPGSSLWEVERGCAVRGESGRCNMCRVTVQSVCIHEALRRNPSFVTAVAPLCVTLCNTILRPLMGLGRNRGSGAGTPDGCERPNTWSD
jgi:hypothetical protein